MNIHIRLTIFILLFPLSFFANAQEAPVTLFPDGAPGALGTADKDIPKITPWLPSPEKANGTAIIILPGDGYGHLADDHEGDRIAEWCNENGIAAFVVQYRISPYYHHPAPMLDAQRAIHTVRARAKEWNIDPNKIGIIGFSAGGHLAAVTATQFDLGEGKSTDPIQRESSRPDFAILGYPVITMTDPHTHLGSRRNLLGNNPTEEMIGKMSAEKNVTPHTTPTFLFHTANDTVGIIGHRDAIAFVPFPHDGAQNDIFTVDSDDGRSIQMTLVTDYGFGILDQAYAIAATFAADPVTS